MKPLVEAETNENQRSVMSLTALTVPTIKSPRLKEVGLDFLNLRILQIDVSLQRHTC